MQSIRIKHRVKPMFFIIVYYEIYTRQKTKRKTTKYTSTV